jgi:S1-C subfamily serine protease
MCELILVCCVSIVSLDDPKPIGPSEIVSALEIAVGDSIERAEPSVVAISRWKSGDGRTLAVRNNERRNQFSNPLGPNQLNQDDPNAVSFDYGSGVVVGPQGEILTAYHVVREAARLVVQAPKLPPFDAEIIAADPRSDLAVIAPMRGVAETVAPRLKPLAIGKAESLRKGAFLIALGNPYNAARNDGRASASWGILSNVSRQVQEPLTDGPRPAPQHFRYFPTLLQLDTKLNQGMSGGAVVNLKGELVGLTTTAADAPGYDVQAGYAVPMDAIGRRVVAALVEGREAEYGFIGLTIAPQVPNQVGTVKAGTPADLAGLQERDLILSVGDVTVEPVKGGLNLALALAPVGQPVKLVISRDGQRRELTVLLSKYPVEGEVIATNRPAPWRGLRVDFPTMVAGSTFSDAVLEALVRGGVGVVEVISGSPADAAGLKRGQIITEVDGTKVRTPTEFRKAVEGKHGSTRLKTELGDVLVR